MNSYFFKQSTSKIYKTQLRNKCKCGKGYELCKILTPCCVHRFMGS